MSKYRFVCLIALVCNLIAPFHAATVSANPAALPFSQQVCEDALVQFRANPAWLVELRDPILSNADEIRDRINRYGTLFRCLSSGGISVVGDMVEVNHLVTLFMLFAGGALFPEAQAEARNYTLTFSDIQDPAVKILRDELGIPAPPGYVYIWLYPSRSDLPKALREYAANPSIRGLTLQSRYIVVFDNVRTGAPLEEYERSQRSKVLSHEFVHAYVKSYLGPKRGFSLPAWYDEGLAIYLSGSSEPSSAAYFDENGRQVTWSAPPKDYARYRDDFKYLEEVLGREKLMVLIRRSILENSPQILLQEVEQVSEDGLYRLAEASRIHRSLTRLGFGVGVFMTGGLLFILFRVIKKQREDHYWKKALAPAGKSVNQFRGSFSPATPLEHLIQEVQSRVEPDTDQAIRRRYSAARSLAYQDDPLAADALSAALTDECAVVRAGAARGLGEWAARLASSARLDPAQRGKILDGLFPLFDRDPANEVRWAAAEAIYRVSGESSLRLIRTAVRRWSRDQESQDSLLHQGWYVQWAAESGHAHLLVEAYPWVAEPARQAIINHLRQLPQADQEKALALALSSPDSQLRDLPEIVLRSE